MQLRVAFTGDFGPSTVSPRTLDSACIARLVKLEGIVTKVSLVRPKVMKTVHYSEAANKFVTKARFADSTVPASQAAGGWADLPLMFSGVPGRSLPPGPAHGVGLPHQGR